MASGITGTSWTEFSKTLGERVNDDNEKKRLTDLFGKIIGDNLQSFTMDEVEDKAKFAVVLKRKWVKVLSRTQTMLYVPKRMEFTVSEEERTMGAGDTAITTSYTSVLFSENRNLCPYEDQTGGVLVKSELQWWKLNAMGEYLELVTPHYFGFIAAQAGGTPLVNTYAAADYIEAIA